MNGSIDVTEGQWTTGLAAAAHGIKLRALAPGNSGGPGLQVLAVPQGSPITSPGQLRGKTIAVNVIPGLASLMVDDVLAGYQIKPSQVHLVTVGFPDMRVLFTARCMTTDRLHMNRRSARTLAIQLAILVSEIIGAMAVYRTVCEAPASGS